MLFREGIHFTLCGEEDIEVIGEAADNEEALNFIEANLPSIAILDADRGKLSGIDVTTRIKQNYPSVSVILIMDSENEEQLFSAMKCGANACMTKDIDPDDLVSQALGISEEAIRHHLDLILIKLVANDHNRVVIEAAQNLLPSIISTTKLEAE